VKSDRSHCPIAFALDLLGDRWTLLILRDLLLKGKTRFQEFLGCEERIATNVLSDRLKKLEANGFIVKRDDPSSGRQFLYAPTKKGVALLPILLELVRWSGRFDPDTEAPRAFLKRLEQDSEALRAELAAPFLPPAAKRRAASK
jgi:DNA-binding HxlR family transcriptional regulator